MFGNFSEFLFPCNNNASLGNTSSCNRQGNKRDNDNKCKSAYDDDDDDVSDNRVQQSLYRP